VFQGRRDRWDLGEEEKGAVGDFEAEKKRYHDPSRKRERMSKKPMKREKG